jgi:hypothetical protein
MSPEECLKAFSDLCPDSVPGWLYKNGAPFTSAALTADEAAIVNAAAGRKDFPLGHCFQNAQKLVLSDKTGTLVYCEGYALKAGLIPLHHGWATIHGKVIDFTWKQDDHSPVLGTIPDGWEYYGATFTREQTEDQFTSPAPSIVDDWARGFPLLR